MATNNEVANPAGNEASDLTDVLVEENAPNGEYVEPPKPASFGALTKAAVVLGTVGTLAAIVALSLQNFGNPAVDELNSTAAPTFVPTSSPTCLQELTPMDIVWIIDESGSVGPANYEKLKQAIVDFTDRFDYSVTRFGLIEFSGQDIRTTYPSTNLKDYAIQETINLFDHRDSAEDFKQRVSELVYTPLDPQYCDSNGNPVSPDFPNCLPQRIYTCISCAFQYALQEYFPTVGPNGEGNTKAGYKRHIIFVGDGVYTRGNPMNPETTVMSLRDAFNFRLVFVPVVGNANMSVNWLGDALVDDPPPSAEYRADIISQVQSYDALEDLSRLQLAC